MELSIPAKLVFSLLLGAAIGLERESYERKTDTSDSSGRGSLGIRSFALITLLGTVISFALPAYPLLFTLLSATLLILIIAYYIIGSIVVRDHGLTTELGVLWSYLIGLLIGLELFPNQVILAITVVVILILSAKAKVRTIVKEIKEYELDAFIGYAIIALVILPFLPDRSLTLQSIPVIPEIISALGIQLSSVLTIELINPFSVWRVVAIITGVQILGYVLERTIGKRSGWILTSIIGGFVSSTSTTQSLAQQSKNTTGQENRLVASALISNSASFLQLTVLLATVNALFLSAFFPTILALMISGLGASIYFSRKSAAQSAKTSTQALKEKQIFSLGPALQFAALFMIIRIITKVSLVLFGSSGFILTNIIGSVSGMDAVSINVAQLAESAITTDTAILTLILANAFNLLSKSVYSFIYGTRTFALSFFLGVLLMIAASFLGVLL